MKYGTFRYDTVEVENGLYSKTFSYSCILTSRRGACRVFNLKLPRQSGNVNRLEICLHLDIALSESRINRNCQCQRFLRLSCLRVLYDELNRCTS